MKLDFSKFDGSGRLPREGQQLALDFVKEELPKQKIVAIMGPPGIGKTAIARAVQIPTGAWVVNPSNMLIDQTIATYPSINFLKGKVHYKCGTSGHALNCQEWVDGLEQKACPDCPYIDARRKALAGVPTLFNPMSLYYLLRQSKTVPRLIIVDEAHLLSGMILKLCSKKFAKSDYGLPTNIGEVQLSSWMGKQIEKLSKLVGLYQNVGDFAQVSRVLTEVETLSLTKLGLDTQPELFAIWFDQQKNRGKMDMFLNVQPIKPPQSIVDTLLPAEKIILLSGTLLRSDVEELYEGQKYAYLDLPSPISCDRRPILHRPVSYPMNYLTPPEKIVKTVERGIDEFPERNTIIHTTYARARAMAPYFKNPILVNTAENKMDVLSEFKKRGGIFLAAGCAEGIDLKDDLCRLNISPHFIRPNLKDPVVMKRRSLSDGDRWYSMQGLKIGIQQYGRSNRDETDDSIHIAHEPQFKREVDRWGHELPVYYTAPIRWGGRL